MPSRSYQLELTKRAHKEVLALQPKIRGQVEAIINRLVATLDQGQRPQDMRTLEGEPDAYRIDRGEYQILFHLDEPKALVIVVRVRHRIDAYRNL